jgi:PAS domain S-box-containing protein
MALEKKRVALYVSVTAAVVALASLFPHMSIYSNQAFHQNISIMSAMVSLFTGLLAMIRYYAHRVCPYLWIGVAFLGNGIIEFAYAYAFSFYPVFQIPTELNNFMIWAGWLGKTYLAIMLLGACYTCRLHAAPPKDIEAYTLGALLLATCLVILFCVKLPAPAFFPMIPRPLEYIPAGIFGIALVGFLHFSDWSKSTFSHWLIVSIVICCCTQSFIIPFSRQVYDTQFMAANVLRVVSHIIVGFGLLAEIFKLYREYEDKTNRLSALRLAVDQIRDYAMFMIDPEGNIITWNKGAEQIKGYKESEAVGKNYSIFYPEKEKRAGKPKKDLEQALTEGHSIDEGWRVRKNGSKFWAYTLITPIYNDMGKLIGFSKITRDLTKHKLLEEELRKQNEMLTYSNEQLTQFAYIATHDLKEPLRTISSFTQLLTRTCKNSDEKSERYAQFIISAVERTRKLIDDLRTYSIISTQNADEQLVDLNNSLADALNLLEKKIRESNTQIITCKLPVVKGSATQLMYLFLHIIDNAIKYAKPGVRPVVEVCCREAGTEYILSIKDNGIGIQKEYSAKLFSIFRKLANREKSEGSGIGLSICKKVITQHGGKIWYTSSSTEGTTFYFSLPMIPALI